MEDQKRVEQAIIKIAEIMGNNPIAVKRLIELTNENSGVQFVNAKGYNSDKSLNTELADHLMNINAKYDKMLDKDALTLAHPDEVIEAEFLKVEQNWNYDRYDLNGVSLSYDHYDSEGNLITPSFRTMVKNAFADALKEKRDSKVEPKERKSGDLWFNKALVWNDNTMQLAIFGISLKKSVKKEGVFKKVKSVPLTVAKQIIDKCTEMKGAKLRRLKIANLNGMKIQGETLELGGGK